MIGRGEGENKIRKEIKKNKIIVTGGGNEYIQNSTKEMLDNIAYNREEEEEVEKYMVETPSPHYIT